MDGIAGLKLTGIVDTWVSLGRGDPGDNCHSSAFERTCRSRVESDIEPQGILKPRSGRLPRRPTGKWEGIDIEEPSLVFAVRVHNPQLVRPAPPGVEQDAPAVRGPRRIIVVSSRWILC